MIPAEENPRDLPQPAAVQKRQTDVYAGNHACGQDCREGAEEANERTHHPFMETDRQKEGYPTGLWRERQERVPAAAYVAITNW